MPVKIEVQTPAIVSKLIARLDPSKASEIIGLSSRQFAPIFLRRLTEQNQRVAKRTGAMSAGWRFVAAGLGFAFFNTKKYARHVELGTKAHLIKPKRKKSLRWRKGGLGPISSFVAKGAASPGNFIFARGVKHPGTKAKLIFPSVVRQQTGNYFSILVRNINVALKG